MPSLKSLSFQSEIGDFMKAKDIKNSIYKAFKSIVPSTGISQALLKIISTGSIGQSVSQTRCMDKMTVIEAFGEIDNKYIDEALDYKCERGSDGHEQK